METVAFHHDPSAGTFSAGAHTEPVADLDLVERVHRLRPPCRQSRLRDFGARPSNARIALLVLAARPAVSITWPKKNERDDHRAGSKYTSICPPLPRSDEGNICGTNGC